MNNFQPDIVRCVYSQREDIKHCILHRRAIGYVVAGRKYIYDGDECSVAQAGDIYYLDAGSYHIENVPEKDGSYEQITFYYSDQALTKIASILSFQFGMTILNARTKQKNTTTDRYIICTAWQSIKIFLDSAYAMFETDNIHSDTEQRMLLAFLIYQIAEYDNCCIHDRIIASLNRGLDNFCAIVQDNIMNDISIGELAQLYGRSESAFKRKFQQHYHDTPHHYISIQRLKYACTLLTTTSLPIADVGTRCIFPNPSHFVRVFHREYGCTPAEYRRQATDKQNVKRLKYAVRELENE